MNNFVKLIAVLTGGAILELAIKAVNNESINRKILKEKALVIENNKLIVENNKIMDTKEECQSITKMNKTAVNDSKEEKTLNAELGRFNLKYRKFGKEEKSQEEQAEIERTKKQRKEREEDFKAMDKDLEELMKDTEKQEENKQEDQA